MDSTSNNSSRRGACVLIPMAVGIMFVCALLFLARGASLKANAAPVPPPDGFPKLIHSTFVVTPELAMPGGAELEYQVEIINTGAFTGTGVQLISSIPNNSIYNEDAWASSGPLPVVSGTLLAWTGDVGFDSSVLITFSVTVSPTFEGVITNTAVITHTNIPAPVVLESEARITDSPVLEITKSTPPVLPGPEKPLTYTISVLNMGQDAVGLPIVVTDSLPISTTFVSAGQGGIYDDVTKIITWDTSIDLNYKEAAEFTFVAGVGDVPSGTVISNLYYQVSYSETELAVGEPYTVTVIDPILFIHKATNPDPIGSNTEASYQLTIFNKGSLATSLVITDVVPEGVDYVSGGNLIGDVVSWTLPSLHTGEMAVVSYTFYVSDVMDVDVSNLHFGVCSAEGVCAAGTMLVSTVWGPTFEAYSYVDPVAHKPGGGTDTYVTPTLVIKNTGPGNAYDATALLKFQRISISGTDLYVIPNVGNITDGPDCGDKCSAYLWSGDVAIGDIITFTTYTGQSTIGGEEGTHYTATVIITDQLGTNVTEPVTGTAFGVVTHLPNLIPIKTAPPVIGQGQLLTYTIEVYNSGLSTTTPPFPVLTESVPPSVTLISISGGGISSTISGTTTISWTLPSLGVGDRTSEQFTVQVPFDMVSGTQIINDDYQTLWWEGSITSTVPYSITGEPVTTTVKEVGLIDSFKVVSPQILPPAETNVLTYVVHVVNSGPLDLTGVHVYDWLPWKETTYLRDAQATSGAVISDIVSVEWVGDVGSFSSELITFSVLVDPWFEGTITNTAVISHTSLLTDVIRTATAYITDDPVLFISKTANPSPVSSGDDLLYTIKVLNLGQQATQLIITDTVPLNTTFIPGSASEGGLFADGMLTWNFLALPPGESHMFTFRVQVGSGDEVVNSSYRVSCSEGVSAVGEPLITPIIKKIFMIFLPILTRSN